MGRSLGCWGGGTSRFQRGGKGGGPEKRVGGEKGMKQVVVGASGRLEGTEGEVRVERLFEGKKWA